MKTIAIVSLVLFSTLFADTSMASEKSRSIDYQKVNSLLSFYKKKIQSPYIVINQNIAIKNESLTFSDIKLWLTIKNNSKLDIPINSDGSISLPLLSKEEAKTAILDINQEEGDASVNLIASVDLPQAKEVSYKELFILLEDFNNVMSEMGGAAAWFAPDMDALSFTFDQPASITITSKKKKYFYETDDEFNIEIGVKKKLMKENPMVLFSILPIEMSPQD